MRQVETIGDCYFVAGGLLREDEDGMLETVGSRSRSGTSDPLHAHKVFGFAQVRGASLCNGTRSRPLYSCDCNYGTLLPMQHKCLQGKLALFKQPIGFPLVTLTAATW